VNCDLLCTHHLNWAIYFPKDRSSPIEHCLMPCRHPAWQHVTQERNRLVCLACQHLLITCCCTQHSALRSFHELLLRIWVGPSGHETCNLQPAKVAWLLALSFSQLRQRLRPLSGPRKACRMHVPSAIVLVH
jgi:hypothetical protein